MVTTPQDFALANMGRSVAFFNLPQDIKDVVAPLQMHLWFAWLQALGFNFIGELDGAPRS